MTRGTASPRAKWAFVVIVLGLPLVSTTYVLRRGNGDGAPMKEGLAPQRNSVSPGARSKSRDSLPASETSSSGRRMAADAVAQQPNVSENDSVSPAPDEEKRKVLDAYHETAACWKYAYDRLKIAHMTDAPAVYSTEDADEMLRGLDAIDHVLQNGHGSCHGISVDQANTALFDLSLRAGQQGDLGAQACFIHLADSALNDRDADSERKAKYLANASHFMDRGVEVAYWPVVWPAAMKLVASNRDKPPWSRELPEPDPYRVYRAVRLAYYRSVPGSTEMLDRVMDDIKREYHLSPQEIAQADRWAQQLYRDHYTRTLPLDPGSVEYCQ